MTDKIHPSPKEFTEADIGQNPILRYFHYSHLPEVLREVSKPFCDLAGVILHLPPSAERTTAFRKLLEAKDCAVRCMVGAVAPARQENFYDRLLKESNDLEVRLEKLRDFLQTPAYRALDSAQRQLLQMQYSAMTEYAVALGKRVATIVKPGAVASEQIDDGVTLMGGDQSETPVPFKG